MKTYLVGGAVRDKLLGIPVHERDWVVVGATAQHLLDLGYQPVGKDFPVFLHPKSKEEYALARTERKSGKGYTGFDCYAQPDVTLEQDLLRRDLTINAIAENTNGELFDPYNGQQDLENKKLRHVSDAFTEDPLRVLRLARFLARFAHLGFTIADETLSLAKRISQSGELETLPAERLWKEIEKSLKTQSPEAFFSAMDKMDASKRLFPELSNLDKISSLNIKQAAINKYSSNVIFALLFAKSSQLEAETLCRRLKCPNHYRDLALLVCQYNNDYQQIQDSKSLLALLESLDAFRRPERFEQFLQCCLIIFESPDKNVLFKSALKACKKVDAKDFVSQGLAGSAIAKALRKKRQQVLGELILLHQTHNAS